MAAKFEVSKVTPANSGSTLRPRTAKSSPPGYESKANAEKGIEAIKTHAPGAAVEDHSG
jgi:hypothetical protein